MSYSFTVKAPSKAQVLAAATNQLDLTIQQQPVHARDREAALANVREHLDLVDEAKENEEVVVSMNGSIGASSPTAGADRVTSVGSGCNVYLALCR